MGDGAKATPVLNLDALFGAVNSPKVVWEGVEYPLKNIREFGAQDMLKMERLRRESSALGKLGDKLGPKQVTVLEGMTDELLLMLNLKLPVKKMPFLARMRMLEWYFEQTAPVEAAALQKKMVGKTRRRRR